MTDNTRIGDQDTRVAAATTFDRNVVVIAGAGTGKTTLLVNRLVYLIMRRVDPLDLARIVALTFTNKAAAEMKLRLRERLQELLAAEERESSAVDSGTVSKSDLRARYGLSTDEIMSRAKTALHEIERAQIGTLHSFAAHLLRLYPIEAGITPSFQTDEDGSRFDEHFTHAWQLWLDRELGVDGEHHQTWRVLLRLFSLDGLRELAYSLHGELIDLEGLTRQVGDRDLNHGLREWFACRQAQAEALLARHDRPKRRKIELILAAVAELCGRLLSQGMTGLRDVPDEVRELLGKNLGETPAGWADAEAAEVEGLQRVAKRLLKVDHELLHELLALFLPFVKRVRKTFSDSGWLTFDGLLGKARTLLRDHPTIREQLKRDYRALLVDEFQDTDPVQYEIVLYLAEEKERKRPSGEKSSLNRENYSSWATPNNQFTHFGGPTSKPSITSSNGWSAAGRCVASWRQISEAMNGSLMSSTASSMLFSLSNLLFSPPMFHSPFNRIGRASFAIPASNSDWSHRKRMMTSWTLPQVRGWKRSRLPS